LSTGPAPSHEGRFGVGGVALLLSPTRVITSAATRRVRCAATNPPAGHTEDRSFASRSGQTSAIALRRGDLLADGVRICLHGAADEGLCGGCKASHPGPPASALDGCVSCWLQRPTGARAAGIRLLLRKRRRRRARQFSQRRGCICSSPGPVVSGGGRRPPAAGVGARSADRVGRSQAVGCL
jgi:hypothetical protein